MTEKPPAESAKDGACGAGDHNELPDTERPTAAFRRAVEIFKALGDEARLRTLEMLERVGEVCVSELAAASDEGVSTVSHRLRHLRTAGLVRRRRAGKHVYYALDDDHVARLVRDALDHASEEGGHKH